MFNLKNTFAAAVLSLATIGSANAGVIVLDSFDYDLNMDGFAPGSGLNVSGGQVQDTDAHLDINAFNGDALYQLDYQAGNSFTNAETNMSELSLNNFAQNRASLQITYTDVNQNAGGFLDLTNSGSQTAFYFDVVFVDLGFDFSVTVVDSNNVSSTVMASANPKPMGAVERREIGFDAFGGGADFSSVAAVVLNLTAGLVDDGNGGQVLASGTDLSLAEFGTVPEPTTLAIFGLGLLGLGAARRRKA